MDYKLTLIFKNTQDSDGIVEHFLGTLGLEVPNESNEIEIESKELSEVLDEILIARKGKEE